MAGINSIKNQGFLAIVDARQNAIPAMKCIAFMDEFVY